MWTFTLNFPVLQNKSLSTNLHHSVNQTMSSLSFRISGAFEIMNLNKTVKTIFFDLENLSLWLSFHRFTYRTANCCNNVWVRIILTIHPSNWVTCEILSTWKELHQRFLTYIIGVFATNKSLDWPLSRYKRSVSYLSLYFILNRIYINGNITVKLGCQKFSGKFNQKFDVDAHFWVYFAVAIVFH